MKQGEETVRQGKAIMVFTVMTIIFVSQPAVFFNFHYVKLTQDIYL